MIPWNSIEAKQGMYLEKQQQQQQQQQQHILNVISMLNNDRKSVWVHRLHKDEHKCNNKTPRPWF